MFTQVGSGGAIHGRRWSTDWWAPSKWIVVWSAWSSVRCHRSVTRTTTILRTRPASSTHMPLHSTPRWPTLSLTAPGPGGVRSSATSCKQHRMPATTMEWMTLHNGTCSFIQPSVTFYVYLLHLSISLDIFLRCIPVAYSLFLSTTGTMNYEFFK